MIVIGEYQLCAITQTELSRHLNKKRISIKKEKLFFIYIISFCLSLVFSLIIIFMILF